MRSIRNFKTPEGTQRLNVVDTNELNPTNGQSMEAGQLSRTAQVGL